MTGQVRLFQVGGQRGVDVLISLSWYCDCAVDEAVEAEPLEAVGDDILLHCREW